MAGLLLFWCGLVSMYAFSSALFVFVFARHGRALMGASLEHNGEFGFAVTLTVNLEPKNKAKAYKKLLVNQNRKSPIIGRLN